MTLPYHPLANLFPMIEGAAFDELVEDVRQNGLIDRIVMLDGQILDGRNRYRAALDAGLLREDDDPDAKSDLYITHFRRFLPSQDGEPLAWVLGKNLHRRHLTESQRALVAARIESYRHGGSRGGQDANLHLARKEAAETLHVSPRSVASARTIIDRGVPELQARVERDLPVSVGEEIAKKPVTEQLEILRNNVNPKALSARMRELRQERQAEKKARREQREADLGARQAALPAKRYGVILADPEWRFETYSAETGMDRAADNHYPTSDMEAIKARPVADIAADDCVLFLWATVPMLPQALEVMAAWGFAYKSEVVWLKDKTGTGYWFRNQHEHLLVGTRGNVPAPAMGEQWRSALAAPVGEHSEKPPFAHEIAEAYFPNLPKIELNARVRRPGWDAWGLEVPEDEPQAKASIGNGAAVPDTEPADSTSGEASRPDAGRSASATSEDMDATRPGEQRPPFKHTRATAEPILRERYDGSNAVALAAELGISVGCCRGWLHRCGLTDRSRNVLRGQAMVAEFNREKHS